MAVRSRCPQCGQVATLDDFAVGTTVDCPACGAGFTVREESDASGGGSGAPRTGSAGPRPAQKQEPLSVAGIISLVLGILGLLLSLIPCVNILGLPLVGLGIIVGLIGFFSARSGGRATGLPLAGTIVSFVGLVISGAWFALFAFAAHKAEEQHKQEDAEIRSAEVVVVTAEDLMAAYQQDEAAADAKYKGRLLEVTGEVSDTHIPTGDDGYVSLATDDEDQDIHCEFSSWRRDEFRKVRKFQHVVLRGTCDGRSFGLLTLEKCALITIQHD